MAEQVSINLNVKTDDSQKSLRAMRQELKQLQIAMDQASDPAEFKRLAAEFATLRNDIVDTSQAMKYMDPGELLSGWTKFAQGAVGSFAAITGAMSLFGSESEEIQEIEKKSMVLIQTMMGLEQARQLLIDGGGRAQLKQLFATTAAQYKEITAMLTKNLVIQTTEKSSKLAAAAQWLWNAAVTAFPIVALVAGVGALTLGIYKLIDAQKEQQTVLSVSQDLQKKQGENAAAELVQLDAMVKKLKDAKDNKKEYANVVRQWNEKYGKEYNASLSTTAFNLDAITNAANKAREAILKKALAAAAEERLQEIVGDNLAKYETYVTATESLRLKKEALAKEEEMYAYFIEQGMTDAAVAQREYINSLKDKIAVGYEAYGLDEDYVKEIETLTQVVANNTLVTDKQTTATKDYDAAVKGATDTTKKLKEEFEEPIEFTVSVDDGPQQITDGIEKLRKEWKAAHDEMMANSLARALQDETWDVVREKMMEYYGQGVIGEEEYNAAVVEYAALNEKANEEAYEFGLITVEEYEKNKTAIAKAESEKRLAALEKEFSAWTDFANSAASSMSSVFSNLTETAQMELDAQDKAWNDSWDARYGKMDESMKRVADIYGTDSMEYAQALKEKEDADKLKADHDALMEKRRKDADNKYKKGSIATDMVKATAEFAKASFGIWAGETSTKGLMGIPIAIALQAMLAASYGTQMAVMAKQMSLVGKMRLGGPVFGPSHESGGVDKNLEGGEFVINAQSMKVPGVAQLANSLNRTGSSNGAPVVASVPDESIQRIVSAVSAIPVVVSERDITGTQRRVAVIESKTSF